MSRNLKRAFVAVSRSWMKMLSVTLELQQLRRNAVSLERGRDPDVDATLRELRAETLTAIGTSSWFVRSACI